MLIVEDIGVHCLVSSETAGCTDQAVAAVVQLNHTCSEPCRKPTAVN